MLMLLLLWVLVSNTSPAQDTVVQSPKVIRYDRPRPTKIDVVVKKPKVRKPKSCRYTVVIAAAQENQPQLPYVGK